MGTFTDDEDEGNLSEFEEHEAEITRGLLTTAIKHLNPRAAITVEEGTSVAEAVAIMNREKIGGVLVVREGRLSGIFTERDVLTKVAGRGLDFTKIFVRDYMTADPEALSPDHKVAYALNKMVVGGYRHVPIVDGERRPVAVMSVRDVVEFIVERFPAEVLNLPPDPDHEMRARDGG
jgi:CBS domain-containing protein